MKLSRILGVVCVLLFSLASWSATPATITLFVDATSTPRKIFHAKLKIPASAGDLTLYYPKWIPGEHAPDGPVIDLAGLKFTAGGKTLKWRRDLLDGFTRRAGSQTISPTWPLLKSPQVGNMARRCPSHRRRSPDRMAIRRSFFSRLP